MWSLLIAPSHTGKLVRFLPRCHVNGVGSPSGKGLVGPQNVNRKLRGLLCANLHTLFVGAPLRAKLANFYHGRNLFGVVAPSAPRLRAYRGLRLLNLCLHFRPLGVREFVLFPGHYSEVNSASWALVRRVLNSRACAFFPSAGNELPSSCV
jgi:hypothetical protein